MLISLTDQGGVKLVLGICLHVTLILYSGVVNNFKKKQTVIKRYIHSHLSNTFAHQYKDILLYLHIIKFCVYLLY